MLARPDNKEGRKFVWCMNLWLAILLLFVSVKAIEKTAHV